MGLFDSKSSTTNVTKVNEAGFSEISGTAQNVNLDNVGGDVNVLDAGAINESFTFANNVLESSGARTQAALNAVGRSASESINAVQAAAGADSGQTISTLAKWATVIAGFVALVQVFK